MSLAPTLAPTLAAVDTGAALARLFELLRIPSVSTDPAFAPHCRAAAEWLRQDLAGLGFEVAVHDTAGHPMVLGHRKGTLSGGAGARRHVLFYGHYDVQPADPLELWTTPPFEPRLETAPDGSRRIVARGACDDKGQLMTFIEAVRAYVATTGAPPVDVTILLEGEEECGSKNLGPFVEKHAAALKADAALVCDTGMWDRTTPAVTTSLRGLVYEEVTVHAADRDLHSGLFGGVAANPLRVLSGIIAALHDATGRVTIPGFYDGVPDLPADVKAQWDALNLTPSEFLGQVGLALPSGEAGRSVMELIAARPTAEPNGIWGGYTGPGSKTVIPADASAKVSFRLVGQQDPDRIRAAWRRFVTDRLPADCRATFTSHSSGRPIALDWTSPDLARARKALAEEWGKPAVTIGSGGSIPVVADFKARLGMDTLLIGFGLDDDRVHSPNEKYELSSFEKGIRSWVRVLDALAA